jgi:hypothetical protein
VAVAVTVAEDVVQSFKCTAFTDTMGNITPMLTLGEKKANAHNVQKSERFTKRWLMCIDCENSHQISESQSAANHCFDTGDIITIIDLVLLVLETHDNFR